MVIGDEILVSEILSDHRQDGSCRWGMGAHRRKTGIQTKDKLKNTAHAFVLSLSGAGSLQVEKVLDAKVFKMEREAYPDGFDPDAPAGKDEEAEFDDADFVSGLRLSLCIGVKSMTGGVGEWVRF